MIPAPTQQQTGFDFAKSRGQLLAVEGVRVGFLLAILAVAFGFQIAQPEFVNLDVVLPVYALLAAQFSINAIYLIFFERAVRNWIPTAALFAVETVFISALIFLTGVNQSIFLFLYLVNIILAGFVFQRRGAIAISLCTSISFSVLMVLGPEIKGQTLFFAVALNNLAFVAVAALSGFLSEQLNFMGSQLRARGKDLAALQKLNELIVRNMATGLVTIDVEGRALLANRSAHDILALDQPIEGLMIEEILPGIFTRVSSEARFDWTARDANQDLLVLDVAAAALRDDEGLATGFVVTFQDSTKVRKLEFAMRQSEKLAAVGQLAAGIAHEIRNPLASISGSIQLLETMLPVAKDAEERKLMRIVLREIDRLNGLISEFLTYVRPDKPKDDPVDLSALAREIFEMAKFDGSLPVGVRQDLSFVDGAVVSGDRDKLRQAILNVVINAYQAMTDAGDPIISASTSRRGGIVRLSVRDRGVGIEEARVRKIFEPFHTTKPRGTGLGLAVTHKVVENHGGKISVESVRGGANSGTEFIFEFSARGLDRQNGLAEEPPAADDFKLSWKRGSG